MAIERVSDGFSGAELALNYQPLEENNVSIQEVAKSSIKRLDDDHNKLAETIEKNPLGDQKLSKGNETLDPTHSILDFPVNTQLASLLPVGVVYTVQLSTHTQIIYLLPKETDIS